MPRQRLPVSERGIAAVACYEEGEGYVSSEENK